MNAPVLLIEDNPDDVLLLERAIRQAGLALDLHVRGDGDAAIEHLRKLAAQEPGAASPLPALVLLDLNLPRRSGLEVLAWLRDQQSLAAVPVVVLTTSADDTDIRRAYELGVNSYLIKPGAHQAYQDLVRALSRYWLEFNARPTHP